MTTKTTTNADLFTAAQQVIPGGVDSPVRAFGSVGGTPRFIESGHGPYVVDAEGTEYIDLVGSWGPALLGHAHPDVLNAVHAAVDKGLSFGAATAGETLLAEEIIRRVPVLDKLRFVSTGTEATMTAVRLARGATGRPLVVKFAGHYHGHSDGLLADAGSGLATFGLPGSQGVTPETAAQTIVVEYNNIDALKDVFAKQGDQIAAVIMEAAAANMGVVAPTPGFNKAVTELAHTHGALLILDEVLTGFRVTPAGYWGVDADYTPDLMTFGKVIGGGMPVAAVGGRGEIMDLLAPTGPVYQAGTLSGNPVAVAAGLATLQLADTAVYERVDAVANALTAGLHDALTNAGVAHVIQRAGNLFSVDFGDYPSRPLNYADVKAQEGFRYRPFFHSMLEQGVALPPSVFEAWFVSAAHADSVVERVVNAFPAAAEAAAAATPE